MHLKRIVFRSKEAKGHDPSAKSSKDSSDNILVVLDAAQCRFPKDREE